MDESLVAEVAELADAQASEACASQGRGGSNPPFRTTQQVKKLWYTSQNI